MSSNIIKSYFQEIYNKIVYFQKKNRIFDKKSNTNLILNQKYIKGNIHKKFDEYSNKFISGKSIIYSFIYLIILSIIHPILSDYNITITTIELNESIYYPILNTYYIGKPIEINISDCSEYEVYDYKYIEDILYIRTNCTFTNLTFVWDDTIGIVEHDIIRSTNIFTTDIYTDIIDTSNIILSDTYNIFKNEETTKNFIDQTTNNQIIIDDIDTDTDTNAINKGHTTDIINKEKNSYKELFTSDIQLTDIQSEQNSFIEEAQITRKIKDYFSSDSISENIFLEETSSNTLFNTEIIETTEAIFEGGTIKPKEPKKINLNAIRMFQKCKVIKTIDFENFDTTRIFNMYQMFDNCISLTNIYHFYPENVQDMSFLFYNCFLLNYIEFNSSIEWINDKIANMEKMFYNCSSLTSLDLIYFNTENVINMNYMFYNCSNLVAINFRNFITSSVNDMEYMFANCSKLTSLNLDKFNTKDVKNMRYMFYNCFELISIEKLGFDSSKVTNMEFMFNNCSRLSLSKKLFLNTLNVLNMRYMFYNCQGINNIELSSSSNVTNMEYMFYGCLNLIDLNINNFNPSKVTNMAYMFSGCESLTILDIDNFNCSNVENMSNMFYNCNNLVSLNLRNFLTYKVKNFDNMFSKCYHLITLDLSLFETPFAESTEYMFSECKSLIDLDLSSFNTSNIINMEYLFLYEFKNVEFIYF